MHPNEHFRFSGYIYNWFAHLELAFRKWKNQDVDDDLWIAWDEAIRWWLLWPGVRHWWEHHFVVGYTDEFKQYISELIRNMEDQGTIASEKLLAFMDEAGKSPSEI